jgi:hypothetical protein
VSKFEAVKGTVSAINALIKQYRETGDEVCLKRIEELSDGIVDEF